MLLLGIYVIGLQLVKYRTILTGNIPMELLLQSTKVLDMVNTLMQKIVVPVVVTGLVSITGLLFTVAIQNAQGIVEQVNTNKIVNEIKIEVKENRAERIEGFNRLSDSIHKLDKQVAENSIILKEIKRPTDTH